MLAGLEALQILILFNLLSFCDILDPLSWPIDRLLQNSYNFKYSFFNLKVHLYENCRLSSSHFSHLKAQIYKHVFYFYNDLNLNVSIDSLPLYNHLDKQKASAGATFSFSSFCELCGCAVEHKCAVRDKGCICNCNCNCNKPFEHGFGSTRSILAELEEIQFSKTFHAVEHAGANDNADANADADTYVNYSNGVCNFKSNCI
jgi:hypothetical protein